MWCSLLRRLKENHSLCGYLFSLHIVKRICYDKLADIFSNSIIANCLTLDLIRNLVHIFHIGRIQDGKCSCSIHRPLLIVFFFLAFCVNFRINQRLGLLFFVHRWQNGLVKWAHRKMFCQQGLRQKKQFLVILPLLDNFHLFAKWIYIFQ